MPASVEPAVALLTIGETFQEEIITICAKPDAQEEKAEAEAEREKNRRTNRLVSSFASTVFAAAQAASTSDGALPHSVLAALLEDPVHVLLNDGVPYQRNTYEEVPVLWQQRDCMMTWSHPVLEGMVHETTQLFVRPLSFGRRRCFRYANSQKLWFIFRVFSCG